MLQAHIDDSGWDGVSPVFVLAGYLAKKEQWDSFSDQWQATLELDPPLRPGLKMKDAYRLDKRGSRFFGWSERQRDDRLIALTKVINAHVEHGIVSVIPIEPYQRILRGKFNPDALDRPYFLSFFGVMTQLLIITSKLKLDDRIDFIFDTQGNESQALLHSEYDRFIGLAPPDVRALSGGPPSFKKDEEVLPLQAADMIAWLARRYYYDLYSGKDPTKEPSNVFFANLFKPEHDVFDAWTEERIQEVAETLLQSSWNKQRGVVMTLPDPSSPLFRA